MSKLFTENPPKIYLKDSDKVRMADYRARIVRETDPREPCDNEDLVFEKAEDESLIPKNALYKWKFDCNHEHEPIWFFTTAERCKEMVSKNPADWTLPKLKEFAEIEKRLYQDWYDGHVYGIVVEKWDEKQREWTRIDSAWGMYGAKDVYDNLGNEIDLHYDEVGGASIPVCVDEEEMKYEFDNVELKVNEFSKA